MAELKSHEGPGLPASTRRDLALLDLGFDGPSDPNQDGSREASLETTGEWIGPYRLVSLLGSGGFGNVWLAEQTQPFRRKVALKLIKPGMDSREIIARFEAERHALALMDHPNIARVLDAGTSTSGRPYFVLELVQGTPITSYCDTHRLGIRERLKLVIDICHAVQHAHQKAVLHRDLKPSNILIAEVDGRVVPKVIDFGIAKALAGNSEEALRATALNTQVGAVIGTPNYMSPEQAGSVSDVDTRSDIYGIGGVLYELLTGTTPLGLDGSRPLTEDLLRAIREQEPVRPSIRLSKLSPSVANLTAQLRGGDVSRLIRALRSDLDWVTMKALEKDRRRRYPTATALAADLDAYLDRKPVTAAAPTWSYRLSKFARRNRAALATVGVIGTTLVAATTVSLWHAADAEQSRAQFERSRDEAEKNLTEAKAAVEYFLGRITQNARLQEPDLQEFSLGLVNQAIPFYEKLAARSGTDPIARSDRASALGRLAVLHYKMGDREKARSAFAQAAELEKLLIAEFLDKIEYRRALWTHTHNLAMAMAGGDNNGEAQKLMREALTLGEQLNAANAADESDRKNIILGLQYLAGFLQDGGKMPEADDVFARACKLQRSTIDAAPEDRENRHRLAGMLLAHGLTLARRNEHARADECFREVTALNAQLLTEAPEDARYQETSAALLNNQGFNQWRKGRRAEGEAMTRKAIAGFLSLAKRFPGRPGYRRLAADCLYNLAAFLQEDKRPDETLVALRQVAEIDEQLAQEFPENKRMQATPLRSLKFLANSHRKAGQWSEARELFWRAISYQEKAVSKRSEPANGSLVELQHGLADVCLHLHKTPEAAAAARRIAELQPEAWEHWYRSAALAALCHAQVTQDATLAADDQTKRLAHYEGEVLELLERAVHCGHLGVEFFPSQHSIPAIATHLRFKALLDFRHPDAPKGEEIAQFWNRSFDSFTIAIRDSASGRRDWTRSGNLWTETEPSGKRNLYAIARREKIGDVEGTELRRVDGGKTVAFIPYRDTAEPRNVCVKGSKGWSILAEIRDKK